MRLHVRSALLVGLGIEVLFRQARVNPYVCELWWGRTWGGPDAYRDKLLTSGHGIRPGRLASDR